MFGFAHAQTASWGSRLTIGMLATGVLLIGVFVALEARVRNPLLPLRVVANRNRGASCLSIGIAGGTIFAVILFLTYYLQLTRGFSPITTGLAFLPMTAMITSAAILGLTKLQKRVGPRPLITIGMMLGALRTLYLTQIRVNSSYPGEILPALIVIGVGLGLVFSTAISHATLGVEPSEAGVASATVNASQQVGGSLGTALLSTIAASATAHYVAGAHHLPNLIGHAAVHGSRRVRMGRWHLRRQHRRGRGHVHARGEQSRAWRSENPSSPPCGRHRRWLRRPSGGAAARPPRAPRHDRARERRRAADHRQGRAAERHRGHAGCPQASTVTTTARKT